MAQDREPFVALEERIYGSLNVPVVCVLNCQGQHHKEEALLGIAASASFAAMPAETR